MKVSVDEQDLRLFLKDVAFAAAALKAVSITLENESAEKEILESAHDRLQKGAKDFLNKLTPELK